MRENFDLDKFEFFEMRFELNLKLQTLQTTAVAVLLFSILPVIFSENILFMKILKKNFIIFSKSWFFSKNTSEFFLLNFFEELPF